MLAMLEQRAPYAHDLSGSGLYHGRIGATVISAGTLGLTRDRYVEVPGSEHLLLDRECTSLFGVGVVALSPMCVRQTVEGSCQVRVLGPEHPHADG